MTNEYRISLIQMKIIPGNVEKNLKKAIGMIEEALVDSPHLIALPEMFATGFHYRDLRNLARKTPEIVSRMKEIASSRAVSLIFSIPETERGNLYNTVFAINERGKMKGRYRKVHLFGLFGEDKHFSRGEKPKVFILSGAKVAPLICYDLRFPELSRRVTLNGAQIIVYSSQWPRERIPHWRTLLAARAVENQLFVAGVNGWGKSGAINLGGNSMVVSPYGDVLSSARAGEKVVNSRLDLKKIDEFREKMPCLKDRFPEAY